MKGASVRRIFVAAGREPNSTHFVAERREPSGSRFVYLVHARSIKAHIPTRSVSEWDFTAPHLRSGLLNQQAASCGFRRSAHV